MVVNVHLRAPCALYMGMKTMLKMEPLPHACWSPQGANAAIGPCALVRAPGRASGAV